MFRSIVVPLDGFAFGEHALPVALGIARPARASLRLLHVMQPFVTVVPELSLYQGPVVAACRQEKQHYLDDLVRRLRDVADVPTTTELLEGEVVPTLRAATEGTADLVVMTTHGRGPLTRFWLGSVADRMVRELTVPLLLVPPPRETAALDKIPALRRILLPLDGTPLAEHVVIPAVNLARTLNAEITLFRAVRTELPLDFQYRYSGAFIPAQLQEMAEQLRLVQQRQQEAAEAYLRSVADRIGANGVATRTKVVMDENPAPAILQEVEAGINLVALATHGYGGLKRLWLGSVADKVLRGSPVPVLIYRPQ